MSSFWYKDSQPRAKALSSETVHALSDPAKRLVCLITLLIYVLFNYIVSK